MNKEELKKRTKDFAHGCVGLVLNLQFYFIRKNNSDANNNKKIESSNSPVKQ
jgi:hypothetical protein